MPVRTLEVARPRLERGVDIPAAAALVGQDRATVGFAHTSDEERIVVDGVESVVGGVLCGVECGEGRGKGGVGWWEDDRVSVGCHVKQVYE